LAIFTQPGYGNMGHALAPDVLNPAKSPRLGTSYSPSLGGIVTDPSMNTLTGSQAYRPTIVAPMTSFGPVGSSATNNLAAAAGAAPLQPPANVNPDPNAYLAELSGQPDYQTGLADYNAQVQANTNALGNALRQSFVQGGWGLGTGAGNVNLASIGGQDFSGMIDPATQALAAGNQMSDRAQLQTQLTRGLADVGSQLGARGAVRSGAANIMAANLQNQYDVAANSAMQNLANAIAGQVGTYAQNQNAALTNWNSLQANIAYRLAMMQGQDPNATTGQTTTTPVQGTSPATAAAVQRAKAAVPARPTPLVPRTLANAPQVRLLANNLRVRG